MNSPCRVHTPIMNRIKALLTVAIWLVMQMGVPALDPTEVNGAVTVEVDRSQPVWSVTVTNHSTEKLSYEMMDKVPRGLGMEVWVEDEKHGGLRIHAENLAFMNMDGFPADIRAIEPGKSEKFQLDPKSMSTADERIRAGWERAKRIGYYDCRVVFGNYASRLMSVSPAEKPKKQGQDGKSAPAWFSDAVKDSKDGELVGMRLRRKLNAEQRSIVHWHHGSESNGEDYIEFTTCAKADIDKMAPWDGSKPAELALHELVIRAKMIAREKDAAFQFVALNSIVIEPCEDDLSKHYAYISLESKDDEVTIELLLNGAPLETTRLRVTEEQREEFSEYRIP